MKAPPTLAWTLPQSCEKMSYTIFSTTPFTFIWVQLHLYRLIYCAILFNSVPHKYMWTTSSLVQF